MTRATESDGPPHVTNDLGQPVGWPVPDWTPRGTPARTAMEGRFCRLEPLDPLAHAQDLFEAFTADAEGRIWTYLPYGPFETFAEFNIWADAATRSDDPLFHAVVETAGGRALGVASYLRMEPEIGTIEVGHINYAPALQRTAAATEAMYLMASRVFDTLGYRRYEWKCDALNAPSRRAAERFGFVYEGTFRQATIYKGRNRDTAWYSMLDREWPALRRGYETWLAETAENGGTQRRGLRACLDEAAATP
jgi:RimJ/RimL family protein N-acetyltransferase